jgi:hypothetical protein
MTLLHDALRAGGAPTAPSVHPQGPAALVVGGAGALGAAVLEALLVSGRFSKVQLLVTQSFHVAMHGLRLMVVPHAAFTQAPAGPLHASVAVVVFDRARRSNGREEAFVRPQPEALPALASWLLAGGVRQLVVVLPHQMTSLPQALKVGLGNLDEQAVAAMGFDHVVFVRAAQTPANGPADAPATRWLQRLADGVMAQLLYMVPQAEQPLRASKVAAFVAELAQRLSASVPGTRVAPPELLWQAAQAHDAAALVRAWLDGQALAPVRAARRRM